MSVQSQFALNSTLIFIKYFSFENDDEDLITESFETLNEGGNYNVHVTVKVKKNLIKDDSAIKCVVKVPDSSYEVKASVEYNGKFPLYLYFLWTFIGYWLVIQLIVCELVFE